MAHLTLRFKDKAMTTEERTFEALFVELEETVRKLEGGELPLDEALTLFERSTALAEQCNTLLDRAELRVRQLTQAADGSLDSQPFEGWQD
jgi:exodeoxyribonuclease VII small subunit